jgi:hypothetical protein
MKVQALGNPLHLPPIQYRLLVQMMLTPEKVVTRKALMAAVWPYHRFIEEDPQHPCGALEKRFAGGLWRAGDPMSPRVRLCDRAEVLGGIISLSTSG